ncbi:MAG: hypothetical protein M3008_01555 [Chloroflexota bacterium]|nr:hypothetical protein [Chloroflexota bacterium]
MHRQSGRSRASIWRTYPKPATGPRPTDEEEARERGKGVAVTAHAAAHPD